MVKTRHSGDLEDPKDTEDKLTKTDCKEIPEENHINGYNSEASDRSGYETQKKRRRRAYEDDSDSDATDCNLYHMSRKIRKRDSNPIRKSSRSHGRPMEHLQKLYDIRRSTREKKFTYDSRHAIEKKVRTSSTSREREPRDPTHSDSDTELEENNHAGAAPDEFESVKKTADVGEEDNEVIIQSRRELRQTRRQVNKEDDVIIRRSRRYKEEERERKTDVDGEGVSPDRKKVDDETNEEIDMYTRVKRERRHIKRDMYGIPINDDEDDKDEKSSSSSGDSDDEAEKDEKSRKRAYNLRERCQKTNLYTAPIEPKRHRSRRAEDRSPEETSFRSSLRAQCYRSPARRQNFRKRAAFHSSSSSSSGSDDEKQFEMRKSRSMAKARLRCLPMNMNPDDLATGVLRDRVRSGASMADVEPMVIDKSVKFDSIGGLGKHLLALKEMIIFPLIYPEVFTKFKITPPKGVLFHGPPGTGKTLVARALANECSQGNTKVAFFMRKGADCLSKWVGESERQLRLLFDQAYQMRPSIIFFDEIDGLAPVRSSRQDQIHSSIVSTLLALMDGLDDRGEVIVIGATNRIDSIDPALRRPGRFDREFLFPLPTFEARVEVLKIHTKEWIPRLPDQLITELAQKAVGYCGADLKALCTEAALIALRRRFPQIYDSRDKLQIDVSKINIRASDFYHAMQRIVPTARRSVSSPGKELSICMRSLLQRAYDEALRALESIFPTSLLSLANLTVSANNPVDDFSDDEQGFENSLTNGQSLSYSLARHVPPTHRPRLLIAGTRGQGQSNHIGPALLHHLESLSVHVIDLPALFGTDTKTPEESCTQTIREAKRSTPSIVYLPHIADWWDIIGDSVRSTLLSLLQDLDASLPLLLIATSETPSINLPSEVQDLFDQIVNIESPDEDQRREYFEDLILRQAAAEPKVSTKKTERRLEVLQKAPAPEPRKLTASELKRIHEQEESTLRELRLFLRDVINKLGRDRKFAIFAKPVDIEDVPDYYEIIANPMDLSMMMSKIDLHKYETVDQFLQDINLIVSNALEYNPDKDPQDRAIRHRACALKDTANAIIATELDEEFEKLCEDIMKARQKRDENPNKEPPVPSFYFTKPPVDGSSTTQPPLSVRSARYSQRSQRLDSNTPSCSKSTEESTTGLCDGAVGDLNSQKSPTPDVYPKRVLKRVRITRRTPSLSKSPWCRSTKRRFRTVAVYVDRDGVEVPDPFGKKETEEDAIADENLTDSEDKKELADPDGVCASGASASGASPICADAVGASPAIDKVSSAHSHATRRQCKNSNEKQSNSSSSFTELSLETSLGCTDTGAGERPSASDIISETKSLSQKSKDDEIKAKNPARKVLNMETQTKKAVDSLTMVVKSLPDSNRLKSLLERTVRLTNGFSVESLEKIFNQLRLSIYNHRTNFDKAVLMEELEAIVDKLSPAESPTRTAESSTRTAESSTRTAESSTRTAESSTRTAESPTRTAESPTRTTLVNSPLDSPCRMSSQDIFQ